LLWQAKTANSPSVNAAFSSRVRTRTAYKKRAMRTRACWAAFPRVPANADADADRSGARSRTRSRFISGVNWNVIADQSEEPKHLIRCLLR
jgi:hypothetical protein